MPVRRVISAGGIVSAIFRRKLYVLCITTKDGLLSFPKGHVEKGESYRDAAIREVKEETGFRTVRIVKKLGTLTRLGTEHDGATSKKSIHLFLMEAAGCTSRGEEEFAWVEFDRAINRMQWKEEKLFLEKYKDVIRKHPSPYFAEFVERK